MTCGIYCITNNINGKQYVGQSIDIEDRFRQHIYSKSNSEIHRAIVEFGVHNFTFEKLIACSPQELDKQEVKFIRLLGTYENGYNQTRGGQHHVFNVKEDYDKYSSLQTKIQNQNKTIVSQKKRLNRLEIERNTFKNESEALKKEVESLNTKIILLEKTIDKSKREEKMKINSLQSKITHLESGDFAKLKKEIKSLKSENKELYFENERLLSKLNEFSFKATPETNIFAELLMEGE